jgi:hypothetical protein
MTTVAMLTPPDLRLAPGTETRCIVTIHNRGEIVEGYHLEVLGDAANWATVTPPQVQVYPGTEATAEILFQLPRGAKVHATDVPFALRVLPMERPEHVVVPEGVLRIGELAELVGELLPQTSRTRRSTTHDVAIDNLGNMPTVVDLTVSDPDNALRLQPRPARMTIGPGRASVARVAVRHRRVLWRGQPVARRFQVTAATPEGPGVALDGTSVQHPLIGKWLIPAAAALLALLMLGAGLWFGLLKPAVKSAATEAGKEAGSAAAQDLENQANVNSGPPEGGGGAEGGGAGSSGGPGGGPGSSGGPGGAGVGPSGSAAPQVSSTLNFQRVMQDPPGGAVTQANMRAASPNRFTIAFVHIMAPQGDSGLVEILIGNNPWQVHQLANIRDYDVHPTPPIEVPANQAVRVRVTCTAVGPDRASAANACYVNVVISGTEYRPAA